MKKAVKWIDINYLYILLMTITVVLAMSTSLNADQAAFISETDAKKAIKFIKPGMVIREYCLPCNDTTWSDIRVNNVKIVSANYQTFHEIRVNGEGIDLAYIYVYKNSKWMNLASLIGLEVKSVPEVLPSGRYTQEDHKHSQMDIATAIQKLQDKDPSVREKAAKILGEKKVSRAVKHLIAALKDDNSDAHFAIAYALGMIGKPAVESLIIALNNDGPNVRKGAADALCWIKDPRALKPLIAILNDRDPRVKASAASALGELRDVTAVKSLIINLKDEDSRARCNSAEALGKIKSPLAIEPLITALKDDDSDVRWRAAEALGEIKSPLFRIEPLIVALKDENINVKEAASDALSKQKSSRAIEPLINLIKEFDDELDRYNAAKALGEIEDPRVVKFLITSIKKKDLPIIAGANKFYIRQGVAGSEDILIEALYFMNSLDIVYSETISDMAENFINSGNQKLEKAGREFAEEAGFTVLTILGGNHGLRWGSK